MARQNSSVQLPALAVLFFLLLALLACGSEKKATATPAPMPTAAPVTDGAPAQIALRYPHQLYTHCGVRYADFDGRKWLADPILGGANPPPGWGNPFDTGTMELVSKDRALFLSDSGEQAFFEPAPEDYEFKICF